ncbi:MAG: hypothetical protein KJ923_00405, partial [Candidatus Omnitrophica bacterium]|nr:hypothetical protein [Candidatus Omnitrophota bacterium]
MVKRICRILTIAIFGIFAILGKTEAATTAAISITVTLDSTAPLVSSIILADTALKAGETSLVTITFSEAVSGFDNTDITTIDNGTLNAVASSDSITWTATFT